MRRRATALMLAAVMAGTVAAKPADPRDQRADKSQGKGPPAHAQANGWPHRAPTPPPPPEPHPGPQPNPEPPGHPDPPEPAPVAPPVVVLPDTAAER